MQYYNNYYKCNTTALYDYNEQSDKENVRNAAD